MAVRKTVKKEDKSVEKEEVAPTFSKQKILTSKKYRHRQDIVNALLQDDKLYDLNEVDRLINEFMKGKVK